MAGRHVPGGGIDYRAMLAHERMLQRQRMAEEERRGSLPLADTEDGTKSPDALALATLAGPVARLRYQRAFLTPAEQDAFQAACTPPPLAGPVGSSSAARRHRQWLTLPKRTLLLLGGVPHPSGMIAEPLPAWVLGVATRLAPLFGGRTPNQVLVNYYEAGCGIDAHADGPLFEPTAAIVSLVSPALMHFRPHPAPRTNTAIARGGAIVVGEGSTGHDWDDSVAAATSLGGGTAQLDVAARAFMEPGSLLVFDQDAFEAFTHEIASVQQEVIDDRVVNLDQCSPDVAPGAILSRRERISLTFRVVKHVAVPADEFVDAATQDEIARRREWWAHAVSEKRS